ncbi:hypothetical protein [Labilibaculum manganireducens]|uniref:hypothetical protein n=1 Tax=Labilibaculum manganireducens TaxID=1940525 RepID=UPI0029F4F741|nr:hypothetical protein [Labilibaculum manganireducens]
MIAATIGRTFLKAWNQREKKNLTAKDFFEQEYFHYFFNHPKYMQWVTNSPFVQELSSDPKGNYGVRTKYKKDGKTMVFETDNDALLFYQTNIKNREDFLFCYENDKKKLSKKGIEFLKTLNKEERNKKLTDFINKAELSKENNDFDGSIVIGYPASESDEFPVFSGQVSNLSITNTLDDIYLSWIGSGLGIGVEGAYTIYFDEPHLLIDIYEGWIVYRTIINDLNIKHQTKQIDTWNGQWLAYKYDKYYKGENDFVIINNHKNRIFKIDEKTGIVSVDTIPWSKLLFSISRNSSKDQIIGFVGTFSKDNKSLGFYPFHFSSANKLIDYYKILFGENLALQDSNQYESLFGYNGLKYACELGSIGLQALEPKGLRKYFGNDSNLKLAKPNLSIKKDESDNDYAIRKENANNKDYENIVTFRTYKTWLIAMITKNKEENLHYSEDIAKAFIKYRSEARIEKKFIEEKLLSVKSKRQFLQELSTFITMVPIELADKIKELRDKVYLMPEDEFGYLFVLLKFDYAYQERLITNN